MGYGLLYFDFKTCFFERNKKNCFFLKKLVAEGR
ncbi:hypothetical protein LNTAR_20403 [Lentisphaera araneosa HTCC2155]|uniref:Uncharacterized protein n=1 Tax=Lentisphaera araneosa HTCC2155 TaxID=313628 RepID=A6DL03_9BACT|nr:hypothetical protein LNTAR_20403 [Lentisphaera araneosa HTCC2155]